MAHPGSSRWSTSSRGPILKATTSPIVVVTERMSPHVCNNDLPRRLLGLYLVAISGGMLANRRRTLATLDEMARSGPWMLFSGMVATAGGLAVVLGHQVWSGGALPVVVTLVGWAALLKGV